MLSPVSVSGGAQSEGTQRKHSVQIDFRLAVAQGYCLPS